LRNTGKKANFGAVKICLFASKEHTKINPFGYALGLMVSEVEPSKDVRGRKLV